MTLLEALQKPDAKPVFLTGAGISLASGIPTFRGSDPDAVWANDVLEKGTLSYFRRDQAGSWAWYLKCFEKAMNAKPNRAHYALVALAALVPGVRVVTQNVDGLHRKAGQQRLVEVHGTTRKVRCTRKFCAHGGRRGSLDWDDSLFERFRAEPVKRNAPRCPACNKYLRAHVLWFDETYASHMDYEVNKAKRWFREATALVCVGTSFSVGVTDEALHAADHLDIPVFIVDPHSKKDPEKDYTLYREKAEEFLPKLVEALR